MAEYIERGALLENLNNIREVYKDASNYDAVSAVDNAIGEVKESPTADVRPERHGEWLFIDDGFYECSECGAFNDRVAGQIYCWKCGAKMDGKDGESG